MTPRLLEVGFTHPASKTDAVKVTSSKLSLVRAQSKRKGVLHDHSPEGLILIGNQDLERVIDPNVIRTRVTAVKGRYYFFIIRYQ
jgi:hypothetical protein